MEELIKRLERVIATGAPDKDGQHPISAEAVLEVIKQLPPAQLSTDLAEVGTDCISRQAAIKATWQDTGYTDPFNVMTAIRDKIKQLPPAQPDVPDINVGDMISRQVAISAICNACGKIDCDKMDKCEKLQLPSANNSEIPNSSDTISRKGAIDAFNTNIDELVVSGKENADAVEKYINRVIDAIKQLPPAQPTPDQNGDLWITVPDIDEVTCIYVQESKSKFCRIFYEEQEQPERIRGRWIEHGDGLVACECSVCHEKYNLYEEDVFGRNFCPNCGAEMEVNHESN